MVIRKGSCFAVLLQCPVLVLGNKFHYCSVRVGIPLLLESKLIGEGCYSLCSPLESVVL